MGKVIKGNFEKNKTSFQLHREEMERQFESYRRSDQIAAWTYGIVMGFLFIVVAYILFYY
ncbi:MAG TPA: hypothetical protein VN855_00480 [Candidatus Acidoferrum sp.]|nr:hypothetical protein [Candidatus Acidoferrum sp.]